MSRAGGKSEVICVDAGSTVAAKAGADAPGGGISLCFCRRGCAAPAFKAATLTGPRRSIPTLTGPRRIILTLNDPAQLLQKNRDQSVGRHFGLCLLCQMVLCPEPLDC